MSNSAITCYPALPAGHAPCQDTCGDLVLQLPFQIVVLAGGTNDFHILPPPALEDWLPSYMDLTIW